MPARQEPEEIPEQFRVALAALRAATVRSEVVLEELPAPQRIAPHAVALGADVVVGGEELATGRLVLLHDPLGQDSWGGTLRLVTFVRAELEPEIAADPLLPGVGWAWLLETLRAHGLEPRAASGTVTRVASESFGDLAERPVQAEMEIRASWTPSGPEHLGDHLAAWCELLCTSAGLPPVPPGVTALPVRRGQRGG
jgi:hypothetical protein